MRSWRYQGPSEKGKALYASLSESDIRYDNGEKVTELNQLLGHTALQMTNHYLRNITPADETAE